MNQIVDLLEVDVSPDKDRMGGTVVTTLRRVLLSFKYMTKM